MEGSHPEDAPTDDGGRAATADLLLGFLSDFRSASRPVPLAAPTAASARRQPPPADDVGDEPGTSEEPTAVDTHTTPVHVHTAPVATWAPPPPPAAPAATPPGYWQPTGRGGLSRRWAAAIGAIAALAVAAATSTVVIQRESSQGSYTSAWDPRVAPIAAFVQSQRGLKWKHPVKVEFLSPARFDALMSKESPSDPKSDAQQQTAFDVMRAIGVASGNVDLSKAAQQFAQSDIVGQYVDADRTVYVSGDQLTPYVRSVLAHELTHALQAEYFDLEQMRAGHADDDSAVTALIEGDAVRVQNAYEQSLPPSDQDLLIQEQEQTSGQANTQNAQADVPQFLIDQAEFPYDFGPTFVSALVATGGNRKVDAAFRNPPVLDAQIVDPETYIPGVAAPKVTSPALPRNARQALPPTGFGEVSLLEMLGDQIGFDQAWSAVQGWSQDRIVAYRQNGRVCADITVLNDSPDSATALLQSANAWASRIPSASARRSGPTVYLHACDPGPDWKPAASSADPYQALAVRSVLMYQLITDAHLDTAKSVCAADQLMTTMGPQRLQDAEQSTDPGSPAVQDLSAAVATAVSSCS